MNRDYTVVQSSYREVGARVNKTVIRGNCAFAVFFAPAVNGYIESGRRNDVDRCVERHQCGCVQRRTAIDWSCLATDQHLDDQRSALAPDCLASTTYAASAEIPLRDILPAGSWSASASHTTKTTSLNIATIRRDRTRSSATAEKQRVSYERLSRLANSSCNSTTRLIN